MQDAAFPMTFADRMTRRHFRKTLPKDTRARFDEAVQTVMLSERDHATDAVTHSHHHMLACAVCTYRIWIASGEAPDAAKRKTRSPICSLWKRSTRVSMWVLSLFSRDIFAAVRSYTYDRLPDTYGPSFEIENQEIEGGFVSEVKTCGYRSFLARHDALILLDLFCEWDMNWINALPSSVRFDRPQTIAKGGASCRFEFRRE